MFDFSATWFSKFVAPECVLKDEVEFMQIRCDRDEFLQGFNVLDVRNSLTHSHTQKSICP